MSAWSPNTGRTGRPDYEDDAEALYPPGVSTGHANKQPYIEYARKTADQFDLRFEEIPGSNTLILKMLTGPWDEDFLVVQPGKTITYLDFKIESTKSTKNP
jgi:hypothetical protein